MKALTAILLTLLCSLAISLPGLADEDENEDATIEASASETKTSIHTYLDPTFDIVILRPVGAVSLVAGSALMVPEALLAAPGGGRESVNDAYTMLVKGPWEDVVDRKLGDLGS